MVRAEHGSTNNGRASPRGGWGAGSLAELGASKRAGKSRRHMGPTSRKVLHGGASMPSRMSAKGAKNIVAAMKLSTVDKIIAENVVKILEKKENNRMALEDIKIRIELAMTPRGQKRISISPQKFVELYRTLVKKGAVIDPKTTALLNRT